MEIIILSRKKTIIIISAFTTLILLSGCLDNEKKKDETSPRNASFFVDNNGITIVWTNFDPDDLYKTIDYDNKNYVREYSRINHDGILEIDREIFTNFPNSYRSNNFVIDSKGNFHVISYEIEDITIEPSPTYLSYVKYDPNLNVIIPPTRLVSSENTILSPPDVVIDKDDNIYITWIVGSGNIRLFKIDTNGYKLTDEIIITNDQGGRNRYPLITIGSKNNIYVKWEKEGEGSYYKKLSTNGVVLQNSSFLPQVSIVKGYPIIQDDSGKLLYLDEDGTIDSNNHVHVITRKINDERGHYFCEISYNKFNLSGSISIKNFTIYSTSEMGEPEIVIDSYDNIHIIWHEISNIFYMKLDDYGNILVDKMKIV